jgi:NAD(P)-dependent dehydrogenase (short-subunit alcohol dehydrogenase family)
MTLSAGSERARGLPRVALVTGGGKGLGAAVAHRLADDGFKVALLGRDRIALERVAKEIGAFSVAADVADDGAIRRAVDRVHEAVGPVSVFVHNAGIATSAALAATSDEAWEETMAVNVTAAFKLSRALVPEMVSAKWGRVVYVASTAGLAGFAYTSAYCASKHALVGLARALAVELARTGVTVNAVCPGFLDTEMTERTIATICEKTGRSKEEARSALEAQSPQRRLFRVDEVAHVVSMLCSADAEGINGQAIAISGGS